MTEYPKEMTPALREVLGIMIFTTGPIAHALRDSGVEIPRKAEAEQAYVLHWLIGLALEHGDKWRPIAGEKISVILRQLKEKQS
jgi:hypothetical protein